jgi:hypothetical protein
MATGERAARPPLKYTQAQLDKAVKDALARVTVTHGQQLTKAREEATRAVQDARRNGEETGRAAEAAARDKDLSKAALDVRRLLEAYARERPEHAKNPQNLAVDLFATYTAGTSVFQRIGWALRQPPRRP